MVMMKEQPVVCNKAGCLVFAKLLHPKVTFLHSFSVMDCVEDAEHGVDAALMIMLNSPSEDAWNVWCVEEVVDA